MSITLHLFAGRDGELATIAARPLNSSASPESVSARTGFVPLSNEAIIASPRRRSTRRVCSEKISSAYANCRMSVPGTFATCQRVRDTYAQLVKRLKKHGFKDE